MFIYVQYVNSEKSVFTGSCTFSFQALYDSMFLMFFNMLFTSLPILVFGVLEQDYSAEKLIQYPYLYKLHRNNYLMKKLQFVIWTFLGAYSDEDTFMKWHDANNKKQNHINNEHYLLLSSLSFAGLWHTCVVYFVVYYLTYTNPTYLYDNTAVGQWTFSTNIFHLVVLIVNIQVCTNVNRCEAVSECRRGFTRQ